MRHWEPEDWAMFAMAAGVGVAIACLGIGFVVAIVMGAA